MRAHLDGCADCRVELADIAPLAPELVVVIGAFALLMLDRYVYGEVSRISPEAPIPVLRTSRTVAMPGGVGNVARNIAALGGVARLGAVIGDDAAGAELTALIAAEPHVEAQRLRREADALTDQEDLP